MLIFVVAGSARCEASDEAWRYTEKEPQSWFETAADDSKWETGRGGFGSGQDAGLRVFTPWSSPEIWLRRNVTIDVVPEAPALWIHHLQSTEVWLNGSKVLSVDGASDGYIAVPLAVQGPVKAGSNLIAVKATAVPGRGPQFVDVHLGSVDVRPVLPDATWWELFKMRLPMWLTIGMTLVVLFLLVREKPADLVFTGAIVGLALCGVITPAEAFGGFVSSALLMVAALFVITAGLRETGVVDAIGVRILGPAKSELSGFVMLALFTVTTSAFLNNTPIVAMLIPVVISWCRKHQVAPSKLLIPLSFLTILGGCCSRIGTSTNLVVDGLMIKNGIRGMAFFEIAWVGLPCAVIGTLYMLTIGRRLLPARKELMEQFGEARREYLVEMLVTPACRLVGQSIEAAGLRRLPGLFLTEIDRRGTVMTPVSPDTILETEDRLVFTGVVETIVDLKKIPGLEPVSETTDQSAQEQRRRRLCEAVVSRSSPLIGQTVREARFRSHYNAAIVAVHRNGERIATKIGDVKLEAGDTLLLQTGMNFATAHRNNPDFYLVSDVEGSQPLRHDRWLAAILIFAALLVTMFFADGPTAMLGAFVAGGLMVITRCISSSDARTAVEWPVLVAIGASFGLGTALEKSGAAAFLSGKLVDLTSSLGPHATLAAIYFVTMMLNELITNNGAAALAFPFCVQAAELSRCDSRPFVMAVALASSLAFGSPVGYQTHMMVYGPGGYRFTDFAKVGIPLNLLLWGLCVVLIPLVWPFVLPG
jgi:di/tricarboxylate transporter